MGIFKESESSSKKQKIEVEENEIEEQNPFNMYTVMESVVKLLSLRGLKNARLLNQDWSWLATKEIERRWKKLEPIMVNLDKEMYSYKVVNMAKLKKFRATLPSCTSLGLFPNFEIRGRNDYETLSEIMLEGSSHLDHFFGEIVEPKMLKLTVQIGSVPPRYDIDNHCQSGLKLKDFYGVVRTCSQTLKELNVSFGAIGNEQIQSESPYETDDAVNGWTDFKFPNLEKIQFVAYFDEEIEKFSLGQMFEILGKGVGGLPKLKIFSLDTFFHNFPNDLSESFARIGITENLQELSIRVTEEGEPVTSTLNKLASNGLNLKSFTLFWNLEFKNWSEYKGYIDGLRIFLETQSKSLQNLDIVLEFEYDPSKFEFTDKMSTNLLDLSIFNKLKKINIAYWQPEKSPKLISNASTSVNTVKIYKDLMKFVSVEDFYPKMKKLTIIFERNFFIYAKKISALEIPNAYAKNLETLILKFEMNAIKLIELEPLLECKALRRLELCLYPGLDYEHHGIFHPEKLDNHIIDQLKKLKKLKIRSLAIRNFVISEAQQKILEEDFPENFEYSCLKEQREGIGENEDESVVENY